MKQQLKKYLMDTYVYSGQEADRLLSYVDKMSAENRRALKDWADGKGMGSREVEGMTAKDLYETYQFNPVVCYLMVDWLEKDAQQAAFFLSKYHMRPEPLISQKDKDELMRKLEVCGIEISLRQKKEGGRKIGKDCLYKVEERLNDRGLFDGFFK